ncbi:MAG TPA: hypothetical protein VFB24_10690, partial [Candidatus Binatia bacterium]|nr:hypothetical protein [Candidatus Binatia bacterium]
NLRLTLYASYTPCGVILELGRRWAGVKVMLGTVALVVIITLTALAVVLYAAYCEAGEDLPCKKARHDAHATSAGAAADARQVKP